MRILGHRWLEMWSNFVFDGVQVGSWCSDCLLPLGKRLETMAFRYSFEFLAEQPSDTTYSGATRSDRKFLARLTQL